MTLVSYDARIDRQSRRSSLAAVAQLTVATLFHRLQRTLRERRDARELAALPADLRKDLGWPGADRLVEETRKA